MSVVNGEEDIEETIFGEAEGEEGQDWEQRESAA
jgi:hypothetical protein